MRVLCVIDHLGSGGAQRQMVYLARGLAARGHAVQVVTYFPEHDFFKPELDAAGIPVQALSKARVGALGVISSIRQCLRDGSVQGVISFLDTPNVSCGVARLGISGVRLIVSERSNRQHAATMSRRLVRQAAGLLADVVVANSHDHADWLRRFPWLRSRVRTIYNGYPLGEAPPPGTAPGPRDLRLLVVGRVGPEKNALLLVEALSQFEARHGWMPTVAWAGQQDRSAAGEAYRRRVDQALADAPRVREAWTWLGERRDIPALLESHHALVHPSFYEGLPNVVCEALVAGRPVLASDICDHPRLVTADRGWLFHPADPASLVTALEALVACGASGWRDRCRAARAFAESALGIDRMAAEYEHLLMAHEG